MFEVGASVVCLNKKGWYCTQCGHRAVGPDYLQVLEIEGVEWEGGDLFLMFGETEKGDMCKCACSSQAYDAKFFKPLDQVDVSALTEALEEVVA